MNRTLADTLLLLDLRRQIAWNAFRSRSLLRQALNLLFALAIGLGMGGASTTVGYSVGRIFRRLPDPGIEPLLPGLILTAIALLLTVVAFGGALGSLFLADDLPLLMAAPVERRAIFRAKLLDGMGWYYALIVAGAAPAMVAYGLALGYGPLFFVFGAVALLGTPLLPTGVAALLVMLVVRFAPARRVREFLGLSAALFGISCSVAAQSARFWLRDLGAALSPTGGVRPELEPLRDAIRQVAAAPIPSLLAGRGLTAAGRGDLWGAVSGLALFLLLTFGLFAICALLAEALYASGWTRLQGSGTAKRRRARVAAATSTGWLARAPAPVAVALKDWRIFPRDLLSYRQVLAPLIALPALYFSLFARTSRRGVNPIEAADRLVPDAVSFEGVATAAGIAALCSLLLARIALTSIAREGKGWWVLKAAPVSAAQVLGGKYLVVALPYVALSTALMAAVSVWNGFSVGVTLYGWYGIQVLGLAGLAVNVACGVPAARLDWDDPRRMTSPWGDIASFLITLALSALLAALLCLPALAAAFAPSLTTAGWIVGLLAPGCVAIAVSWLSLQLAAARLPSLGEA